jgi:hypothetical protein
MMTTVTLQELLQEQRVDRELLWDLPYDGLHLWTRLWRFVVTQQQAMRRFDQSPSLAVLRPKMKKALETLQFALEALRLEAEGRIEAIVAELPEWKEWARHVPGVGALSLGKLLGLVGNPAARPLFSSLARHCGVAVVDGKVEKPSKGQKRPYNSLAKSQLYLIVGNVLKAYPKAPNLYGEFYYLSRKKFERKHPEWTDMHRHLASVLRTARLFLSHLWEVCRRTQGLPVREPYPIEYDGHTIKIPAEMALHPFKRRDEVVAAIEKVLPLLDTEPDKEVREEATELVRKMSETVSQGRREPRNRRDPSMLA